MNVREDLNVGWQLAHLRWVKISNRFRTYKLGAVCTEKVRD